MLGTARITYFSQADITSEYDKSKIRMILERGIETLTAERAKLQDSLELQWWFFPSHLNIINRLQHKSKLGTRICVKGFGSYLPGSLAVKSEEQRQNLTHNSPLRSNSSRRMLPSDAKDEPESHSRGAMTKSKFENCLPNKP